MPRKLDPVIAETLKKYGFGPEAVWDCHGAWVVYHRCLELIAAKAGVVFEPPMVIEANGRDGVAAICVTGRIGDKVVWSIGEASPKNCKNTYPFAMAEKRAADRVILKLIGLHGLAYSEEEADDFKAPAPAPEQKAPATPSRTLEQDKAAVTAAASMDELKAIWTEVFQRSRERDTEEGQQELWDLKEARKEELSAPPKRELSVLEAG